MEVEWSNRGKKGLVKVVEYLEENWGKEQILELENDVASLIEQIQIHNNIGIQTKRKSNIRRAYPNKHTYLTYRFHSKKKLLYIVNFRATKQKPL